MNEQARKLYDQAQADYPTLKTQIEAQVVRWFGLQEAWDTFL